MGGRRAPLRRAALAGDLTSDTASLAHADLGALRVDLFPYGTVASRVWALRGNLTPELLDAELATLDARLARASGPRCRFLLPAP